MEVTGCVWVSVAVDILGLQAQGHPAPSQVVVGLGMPCAGLREENSAGSLSGHDLDPRGYLVGAGQGNMGVRNAEGAWLGRVCGGNFPQLPS